MLVEVSQEGAALVSRLLAPKHPLMHVAKRHEKDVVDVFLLAVRKMRASIDLRELKDVLSLGVGSGAALHTLEPSIQVLFDTLLTDAHLTTPHSVRTLRGKAQKLDQVLFKTLKAGADVAALDFEMVFDAHNPLALDWAQRHAAELVVQVGEETRQAIRTIITSGIDNGVSYTETASLLKNVIGLTERDSLAVMKLQLRLMQAGKPNAKKRAEKYADTLLHKRAKTIAVNETITASNEGQRQLWRQAQREGYLNGRERKTIIQADPCPICAPIAGEIVGINEAFSIGLPPFHVRCRCIEGII